MTSETSPYPEAPLPATRATAARGWTGSDLAIGSALTLLVIALFLPWFSTTVRLSPVVVVSSTGNGPNAHGYLWCALVLAIVALAVLVARDVIERAPGNLPSAHQMLVGATGLTLLLTILGLAMRPAAYATPRPASALQGLLAPHFAVVIGWSYGGFVALVAAAVAFVAALGVDRSLQTAGHAARALRRRPS